jgi:two-component system nitrate/nitrite response regulator NarL
VTTATDNARTADRAPRVTIIEGHASLADALHATFEKAGFRPRVVDPTQSLATLVNAVLRHPPDVVILGADVGLLGDRNQLVSPLARAGLRIIVLAGHVDDPVRWGMCLAEGATTVVQRTWALDDFLTLVRTVADGSFVPSPYQRALQRTVEDQDDAERRRLIELVSRLTSREREILADLTRARTATEIAAAAFVSEETVRTQIRAVLRKLEVSSQLAAVAIAHRAGFPLEPW